MNVVANFFSELTVLTASCYTKTLHHQMLSSLYFRRGIEGEVN
jgi:hypothetical protein